MTPATFRDFAAANDAATATSRKLQKQAVLADYLRTLDDADLKRAVRYCAGEAFASTDGRVLHVSGATMRDVVLALLGIDPQQFSEATRRAGEIGEALAELWPEAPAPGEDENAAGPLLLAEVEAAFDALAATGNQQARRRLLGGLLSRAGDRRQAAYLGKVILGDMRTGVKAGVLQAALAEAFDRPLADVQRAGLLLGDLDEVAVLAKHDRLGEARFRLFHPIQFMLATPQETADEAAATIARAADATGPGASAAGFLAEDKFDGIRAHVHKAPGRTQVYSRTLDRIDESFPEVVEAVSRLRGDVLLDGEIVPWKAGKVQAFASLQRRLGRRELSPAVLAQYPVAFIAFDVLYADGQSLLDEPLHARRARLEALLADAPPGDAPPGDAPPGDTPPGLMLSQAAVVRSAGEIQRCFDAARERRNEGLMLKDPHSRYTPGSRGGAWLKLKTHLPTLDCVVTAAEYGHGRKRQWLSDYTFAVWDREPDEEGAQLVNIGKAYSGVTDQEIGQLTETFLALSRGRRGRVHQVEPRVVLEIAADAIQPSRRHAGGYALRFPRIKRIRHDKRPEDADRLARVRQLYESTANFGHREEQSPPHEAQLRLFD